MDQLESAVFARCGHQAFYRAEAEETVGDGGLWWLAAMVAGILEP